MGETLTRKDLEDFQEDLLKRLKKVIQGAIILSRGRLKSYEVRELLGISRGTLQNMRLNGTLRSIKQGGLLYYDAEEVWKVREEGTHKDKKCP